MGTPLGEWNQVGIIVDMETSPFDYLKRDENNDFVTEDALRDQCTKYLLYGTVEGVVAERLDEILDRNSMNYQTCALRPLDEDRTLDIRSHSEEANVSNPSSPSSQKYRARSRKANASSKKTLHVDTDKDDDNVDNNDVDKDKEEADVFAEDYRRSARQKAIKEHNDIEDSVDFLFRLR